MPEFVSQYSAPGINPDAFVRGYLQAAEFTDCGPDSEATIQEAEGWAPEAIAEAAQDCADFQAAAGDALQTAYDMEAEGLSYTPERAGVDFWFTRNHHGAGFWDRGLGEVGRRLTEAAHAAGSRDVYAGDDGYLYFYP